MSITPPPIGAPSQLAQMRLLRLTRLVLEVARLAGLQEDAMSKRLFVKRRPGLVIYSDAPDDNGGHLLAQA